MSEHDEARRSFLIKSAASVGAVAGATMPGQAEARSRRHRRQREDADAAVTSKSTAASHASGEHRGLFFSEDEAATVAAFAERIMPGAPGKAGARDAGVINYIDGALAGAYADQQEFYRRGLAALDAYCNATFKESFLYLKPEQQDLAIGALEEGKATGFAWPNAQAFFNTLRTHTMEGMFADPVYGGNRDFVGWKLVGFPGAQRVYTPADMASKETFKRATIGLQSVATTPSRRG